MMEKLIRNIFIPLWLFKDGNLEALKYYSAYEDLNIFALDEIKKRQIASIVKILKHAYEYCPYYHDKIPISLLDISTFNYEIFNRKVPILSKNEIFKYSDSIIAKCYDMNELLKASTGGSTGTPMEFYRDKDCLRKRKGQDLFFDRWMGYEIGKKYALFVASAHTKTMGNKIKSWIRNSTSERMLQFDPSSIEPNYVIQFTKKLLSHNPSFIKSFPNAIIGYLDVVERLRLDLPKVNVISCTGENLYDYQKERIESAFEAEVYEKYGTKECGVIACECHQHNGLHLFTDGVFMEVVKENGDPCNPGEIGRVILTDLFNKGMPLIRYEIGDLAIASDNKPCKCGCYLPKVEKIIGRDRDIIYDENNNPRPGYLFVEIIHKAHLTGQYQIIQKSKSEMLIKHTDELPAKNEMISSFKKILGESFRIYFEHIDYIPRDPSGKYRYVKSLTN